VSETDANTAALNPATANPVAQGIDRAWWVLLGASLCMFCGQPAVVYYTFGVFLPEILADTRWSGTAIAAAIGPGALIAAAVAPLAGRLCDRFGVRAVVLVGGPTYALGLALLGLWPTSAATFTAVMMLMWLLAFAASPVPYSQMITGWFERRRGLALSIIFCCGALGIAVWPPLAAALIDRLGWRQAYVGIGVSAGAVLFLCGLLLLKNVPLRPASVAGLPASAGLLVREALRTARFWKVAATFLLLTAVLGGTAVTFPVVLRQHGADPQTAASILSAVGVAMFFGRLSLGLVLDRWFAPWTTIAIALVGGLSFVVLMTAEGDTAFLAAALFLGFGLGAEYAAAAYIASRAFGLRAFGAIYGLITLATSVGAALGPAIIGACLVQGVDNRLIYGVALGVLGLAILILLTVRRADLPYGGR